MLWREARMVRLGPNLIIVRPIWTRGPLNAAWSKNVSHSLRCLNSRVTSKKAYKQVPAEPSLAGFAVMVQWHPQKCCPAFLVGRTQFFGGKSCPVNFARVPDWCCHALATMAGLATSHCVDDVLAVDRKTTIFSGWRVWRVLAACCGWVVPDSKSPLPSQVHRILGATSDLSQTPCGPPTLFNLTRQSLAIDMHDQRHFGIRSLTSCNGRQSVGTLGVQLHSDVWSVWQSKTSSFFTSPT